VSVHHCRTIHGGSFSRASLLQSPLFCTTASEAARVGTARVCTCVPGRRHGTFRADDVGSEDGDAGSDDDPAYDAAEMSAFLDWKQAVLRVGCV
jgi:hypothetical protein